MHKHLRQQFATGTFTVGIDLLDHRVDDGEQLLNMLLGNAVSYLNNTVVRLIDELVEFKTSSSHTKVEQSLTYAVKGTHLTVTLTASVRQADLHSELLTIVSHALAEMHHLVDDINEYIEVSEQPEPGAFEDFLNDLLASATHLGGHVHAVSLSDLLGSSEGVPPFVSDLIGNMSRGSSGRIKDLFETLRSSNSRGDASSSPFASTFRSAGSPSSEDAGFGRFGGFPPPPSGR